MSKIAENFKFTRKRINNAAQNAGRLTSDVQLLVVSKMQSVESIRIVADLGQKSFGESYLSEALPKIQALQTLNLEWHHIGTIQSRQTQDIAKHFDWVHGVDREKIANRLSSQRPRSKPPLQVCLQVNISGETKKSGVSPEQLPIFYAAVKDLPGIQVRGLMSIPKPTPIPSEQKAVFLALAKLAKCTDPCWDTLSMGMSGDYEVAVQEGATWVRIGTAIFGHRSE